ncbi:MAG: 1-acyl-sn-glycerol-3-phosphate acyltransferase [Elusimicrobia bacterium]|nr:1-acyl-sn-glycerol-3-phosphate acyltransferase [Elusimicrobiota bacterium]
MLEKSDLAELRRQEFWSLLLAAPVYAFTVAVCRWRFGYRLEDLSAFRARLWEELGEFDGPLIWAANHLTLIDSFLIFWAVTPWSKIGRSKRIPWSTPEYRNYYHLGGWLQKRLIRALMYLCRCIPFLREGEDEASVRWRETVFQKCVQVLKEGGSVFVYPEAGRSRSGWLEPRRPKDFLGRLALEAPNAKFLCVYLRGEGQIATTVYPAQGERLRMTAELIPAVLPGETAARQISQRLFDKLGALQQDWFSRSALAKNCGGNDVVDLKSPLAREHFDEESREFDPEWTARHLTAAESKYLDAQPPAKRFSTFWKFFAAKEAAHKALAQSGIWTPTGGFWLLEADLFRRKVLHRPTGAQVSVAFTDEDEDKVHCIAVLRGGYIGDDDSPGDVLWGVEEVPQGRSPGEFARERCLEFIAKSSDDISSAATLAFTEEDGIPKVLRGGKTCDWGVSLSHSGRYAAYSFMAS